MDKAVTRYQAADPQAQLDLRARMEAFGRLYTFLSQVIPYDDSSLEKLDAYLRFLDEKLGSPNPGAPFNLDKDVNLKYYRLQKIGEGRIVLEAGIGGSLAAPSEVGTGRNEDAPVLLSPVVQLLNDRFGANFTAADEFFWEQVRDDALANQNLQQAGAANTRDDFAYALYQHLEQLVVNRTHTTLPKLRENGPWRNLWQASYESPTIRPELKEREKEDG